MSSVRINNLSLSANETTLREFFSFCGGITRITLVPVDSTVQSAVIDFDNEPAAKTAGLLTNALIGDKPITVVPESAGGAAAANRSSSSSSSGHHYAADSVSSSGEHKPSRAAELLASTILGVKSLDSQYHITERTKAALSQATETAKQYNEKHGLTEKVKKINEEHQITDKLAAAKSQTVEKAKEIDERYAVKSQAKFAGFVAAEKTKELTEKALAVPTVASAVGWIAAGLSTLKSTVSIVAAETKELVHQQQQQQQVSHGEGYDDEYSPPPAYNTAAVADAGEYPPAAAAAPVAPVGAPSGGARGEAESAALLGDLEQSPASQ